MVHTHPDGDDVLGLAHASKNNGNESTPHRSKILWKSIFALVCLFVFLSFFADYYGMKGTVSAVVCTILSKKAPTK